MTERPSDPEVWDALHAICDTLPNVTHKRSHGETAWFVGTGRNARQFATTWDHHHDDRNAVLMAAAPGAQQRLTADDPHRFFRPPYVGSKGWIGIYLDTGDTDWDLVELHLTDAHALMATHR